MNRYYYDLHIHSCLSPCADDDMTVNNIAGMASVCGLNLIALTDHNTTANCRPFYAACRKYGVVPIAGAEITTAEEIHIIALFPELEKAEAFESVLLEARMKIRNNPEVFGNQIKLDADDNQTGTDEYLLPAATSLGLAEAVTEARRYGAFVYPAHIDRPSNGIIGILGTFPEEPYFTAVEYSDSGKVKPLTELMPSLVTRRVIVSSDAHTLGAVKEASEYFELDDEPYSSDKVRKSFFALLGGAV